MPPKIIDTLRTQSELQPNPVPTAFPFDVPARVDGFGLLVKLYDKAKTGTIADIAKVIEELEADA